MSKLETELRRLELRTFRCPADYRKLLGNPLCNALECYVNDYIKPGDFLYACLCNTFTEAVCRADPTNLANIKQICWLLENELPPVVWGSEEAVKEWLYIKATTEAEPGEEQAPADATDTESIPQKEVA